MTVSVRSIGYIFFILCRGRPWPFIEENQPGPFMEYFSFNMAKPDPWESFYQEKPLYDQEFV